MKSIKITTILFSLIIIAACSTAKKTITSTTATTPTPSSSASNISFSIFKPADATYQPGMQELDAIQAHYQDVTMDLLNEGYSIYIKGACIGCHGPKDIYKIDKTNWPGILDGMAKAAEISDVQKDSINKYFLAVKATQVKSEK